MRRAVSVVKKRGGQHQSAIREFQLTKRGLVVGPPPTQFRGMFTGTPNDFGESKPLMVELGDGTSS